MIARNHVLMKLRGQTPPELVDAHEILAMRAQEADLAQAMALEDLFARDAMRAVARLSEAQRRILFFRYTLDMTQPGIAGVLGVSADAVRKHEKRALDRLREQLPEPQTGCGDSDHLAMRIRSVPPPVTTGRREALDQRQRGRPH